MGVKLKSGQKVFIDSAPLIYWFEENPSYVDGMSRFFDEITEKQVQLITSMVTYIEVLTHPEKSGKHDLAVKYRNYLLNSEQIIVYPLDVSVADAAIQLRASHSLRTPDAIQLGTAQVCSCDYILSNDKRWKGVAGDRLLLVQEL